MREAANEEKECDGSRSAARARLESGSECIGTGDRNSQRKRIKKRRHRDRQEKEAKGSKWMVGGGGGRGEINGRNLRRIENKEPTDDCAHMGRDEGAKKRTENRREKKRNRV